MQLEVHPSAIEKLAKMHPSQARRFLKQFGFTHSEQDKLIQRAGCKRNKPVSTMQKLFDNFRAFEDNYE